MRNRNGAKVPYALLWLVVAGISLAPLATMLGRLFEDLGLVPLLWDSATLAALGTTALTAGLSLLLALTLALPCAWLVIRTDLKLARFFRECLVFPYFVPSYLFAIAWVMLAVPEVGILNRVFGPGTASIYTTAGLTWVFCNAFFPVIVLSVISGLESMDPSLEEAGRISGARPATVFWKITLPCLMPVIASSSLLFLLLVTSAFGIPAIVGNPAKIYVLTTKIYLFTKMGGLRGIDQGFVISLWLIVLTLFLTYLNHRLARAFQVRLTGGKAARASRIKLGGFQTPAALYLAALVFLLVVLPLGAIILSSFLRISGDLTAANFTLANYHYLFNMQETGTAFFNSFALALAGGVLCAALGFGIAYYQNRTGAAGRDWLARLATLPFAIPGTVIALSLIVSYGSGWGGVLPALLGSHFLLLLAYVSKDLAIAVQSLTPAIAQIDPSLDEAARISGASARRTVFVILLPILKPALFSVILLSSLPMLSELTMSVLLYGPGTETLGTVIFQLQDYAEPLAACALATLVILILGFLLATKRLLERRYE